MRTRSRTLSWLDIDHFPDSQLGLEDSAAKDKPQAIGNIEDEPEPDGGKDRQAKDGPHEVKQNVNRAEDRPKDDAIIDLEMDGIEVDGEGSYGKDGHRAWVDSDTEEQQNSSNSRVLQGPNHTSPSHVVRRGRGRPRRSRTAITASDATWEVIRIAGDK
ncbi:MAG: hypothetical protein Q9164_001258 [Protoblastenia rupestris]